MQILVAVADVAVVDESFEIEAGTIPDRFLEYELNEWDEYALETAVQFVENGDAEEVVTVTIGPERTEETIRKALAKGADRAIRIWDDALASHGPLDSRAKARVLAGVIERESPELVLTGVQTDDDMFGATGVGTAALIAYSWAAVVNQLELDNDHLLVSRELEGGQEERTRLQLPAVCTIQTGINEPRYASLRGIRMAQRAEIETATLEDLDLNDTALETGVTRVAMERPVVESTAEIYEGSPTETAGELAAFLREQGVGD